MDPGLSNLVISISALFTAAATVAIAFLTRGTVKLYQLEKARREAEGSRLAAALGRFQAGAEEMVKESRKAIRVGLPPNREANLDRVREKLAGWERDFEAAWGYAAELGLHEVMANLHCAEIALGDLWDDLPELEGNRGYSAERPFLEHLKKLTRFVQAANESLPVAMRDLEGKSYLAHLDAAASRVLQPAADEAEAD